MTRRFDVLVIGGGIAGVSLAYEVAESRSVGLIDMEPALAYHTSGRSMAMFLESYGGPVIRALTSGSRAAFENPPDIVDGPLLSPRGLLWVGTDGRTEDIQALYEAVQDLVPDVRLVDGAEAEDINPALAKGYTRLGLFEPRAMEIDVHALHQGYVKGLRRRGGTVVVPAQLAAAQHDGLRWDVRDTAGNRYEAEILVNAAGSWVDEVARLSGVNPIGIRPLRRTAFLVSAPEGITPRELPLTANIEGTWYFLPHGGGFACSPADETLQDPCDAKPDPVEIARALEEINRATVLNAKSIKNPWAGLRNFAPDGAPVVGYDDSAEGFFWYAGQGGYGMQIAPALARAGAALVDRQELPADLTARGVKAEHLMPCRLA